MSLLEYLSRGTDQGELQQCPASNPGSDTVGRCPGTTPRRGGSCLGHRQPRFSGREHSNKRDEKTKLEGKVMKRTRSCCRTEEGRDFPLLLTLKTILGGDQEGSGVKNNFLGCSCLSQLLPSTGSQQIHLLQGKAP